MLVCSLSKRYSVHTKFQITAPFLLDDRVPVSASVQKPHPYLTPPCNKNCAFLPCLQPKNLPHVG